MKLKLTDRDKKLLIGLAAVLLVVGVGAGILYPLVNKGQELAKSVENAKVEKQEKEEKIVSLPMVQKEADSIDKNIAKLQKEFYPVMQSMEIDQLITETASSQGANMKTLDIALPGAGEYVQIPNYSDVLNQASDGTNAEPVVYDGIYSAQAQMTMEGTRENLQSVLDLFSSEEPKMRILTFSWQTNDESKTSTLSVSMELYMYQDMEQYVADKQQVAEEEAAAAEAAETASEETE